ncbi:tripartite tricarboxylate transporter substrate binding protein [Neobacillus mesonae]|uniref:tripartite tricarboxylate transporter substrate binding protein n=1 Tax=Neobacillus mesonae TaxID=1193713 RepID=UPI00203F7CD7|nr:tripartite tricarboxylate transporter substrate binding protein [Neobacillus mesonae]MCM3571380.1 tripartite tricarboxylate transporter substrate binding protein [Neobacillus mesonae]
MKGKISRSILIIAMLLLSVILGACSEKEASNQSAGKEGPKQTSEKSSYPSKPIQVIVPAGAGGDTDLNARLLGKYLEKELGQPIVISNVNGAGGSVGAKQVLDSNPDGYNVLFFHNSLLLNKILGLVDYSYDSFKLAGISLLDQGNTFIVNSKSKFKDLKDMIAYAKKNPGKVTIATEVGGFTHLQLKALEKDQGIKLNIVDVGSASEKITALMGNRVDIVPTSLGLVTDYIKSKKFRTLGIMAKDRVDLMPDVPTFIEQGANVSFEKFFFYGFPKETPDDVVEKFSKAVEKVVNNKEYIEEAKKSLVTPTYMNPQEAFDYIKETDEYYKELNSDQ